MKIKRADASKLSALICLSILSLTGAFAVVYATAIGPWAGGDSTSYIVAARNLLDGQGLTEPRASGRLVPLSLRPPFYPLVLGFLGWLGMDLVSAARWLNVVLFAGSILLIGLSFYRLSSSFWLSFSVAITTLLSPVLLANHSSIMSEPLLIFLGISSLILLLGHFERDNRLLLCMAAILAGLSFLTRSMGAAIIASGSLAILLFRYTSPMRRVLHSLLFGLITSLPMVGWLIWLRLQPEAASLGSFSFNLEQLWSQLSPVKMALAEKSWVWNPVLHLFPVPAYRTQIAVLAFLSLFGFLMLALSMRKMHKEAVGRQNATLQLRLIVWLVIFIASSVALISFSYLFVIHPKPALDDRILFPIYHAETILIFAILAFILQAWPSRKILVAIPMGMAFLFAGEHIQSNIKFLQEYHRQGGGYTSLDWQTSGTIEAVRALPLDYSLISNDSAAILFLTNRPAYDIPELFRKERLDTFTQFGEDLNNGV